MADSSKNLIHSTVQTSDNTNISYYSIGNGPSLIIIHGAVSSALTQLELAHALSFKYTVHIYSRRSRGLSGPYPESVTVSNPLNQTPIPKAASTSKDGDQTQSSQSTPNTHTSDGNSIYSPTFSASILHTDLSDLAYLIQHTHSIYLLGISGGAALTIEALLSVSVFPAFQNIQKAIIFEPPLSFPSSQSKLDHSLLRPFESAISSSPPDLDSALVAAMLCAQLGPPIMASFPRVVLRWMTRLMCNSEDATEKKRLSSGGEDRGKITMRQLCPALRYEFALVESVSCGGLDRLKSLGGSNDSDEGNGKGRVLLLGGSDSPPYLRDALRVLEETTRGKGVERVEIQGVGHGVLGNKDRRGDVQKAVPIISEFLG